MVFRPCRWLAACAMVATACAMVAGCGPFRPRVDPSLAGTRWVSDGSTTILALDPDGTGWTGSDVHRGGFVRWGVEDDKLWFMNPIDDPPEVWASCGYRLSPDGATMTLDRAIITGFQAVLHRSRLSPTGPKR